MRISDWSSDVCSSDLIALVRQRGRFQPEVGDELQIAERDALSVDRAFHALAGNRLEIARRAELDTTFLCARHDRLRQGVLRRLLQRGGEAQHFGFVMARFGQDSDELRYAFRPRAGLVDAPRLTFIET